MVAALAAVAVLAHPAAGSAKTWAAAPPPLQFDDLYNDANAVNDGGLIDGVPIPSGTSSIVSVAPYDISALTIAATGRQTSRRVGSRTVTAFTCTGYTATISLLAAPLANASLYRVLAHTDKHKMLWLEWATSPDGTAISQLRIDAPSTAAGTKVVPLLTPAKAVGHSVVFTVGATDVKHANETFGRTVLFGFGAQTRGNASPQATVPMWDQLKTDPNVGWKVC